MLRKLFTLVSLVVVAAFILTGCGPAATTAAPQLWPPPPQPSLQPLQLRLLQLLLLLLLHLLLLLLQSR